VTDPNTDFNKGIVDEILEDLSLHEKSIIAHMDEVDLSILQAPLDRYAESKGSRINDGKDVLKRIWSQLYESHRLKVVK